MGPESLYSTGFVLLEGTLLWKYLVRLAPTTKVVHNRVSSASSDDPDDILVAVIDLLMLGIRGDQSKVSGSQLLSLLSIWSTDYSTATLRGEDSGV